MRGRGRRKYGSTESEYKNTAEGKCCYESVRQRMSVKRQEGVKSKKERVEKKKDERGRGGKRG